MRLELIRYITILHNEKAEFKGQLKNFHKVFIKISPTHVLFMNLK